MNTAGHEAGTRCAGSQGAPPRFVTWSRFSKPSAGGGNSGKECAQRGLGREETATVPSRARRGIPRKDPTERTKQARSKSSGQEAEKNRREECEGRHPSSKRTNPRYGRESPGRNPVDRPRVRRRRARTNANAGWPHPRRSRRAGATAASGRDSRKPRPGRHGDECYGSQAGATEYAQGRRSGK